MTDVRLYEIIHMGYSGFSVLVHVTMNMEMPPNCR